MINFLALEPLFIILTISYEGLFYFAISITLFNGSNLNTGYIDILRMALALPPAP